MCTLILIFGRLRCMYYLLVGFMYVLTLPFGSFNCMVLILLPLGRLRCMFLDIASW